MIKHRGTTVRMIESVSKLIYIRLQLLLASVTVVWLTDCLPFMSGSGTVRRQTTVCSSELNLRGKRMCANNNCYVVICAIIDEELASCWSFFIEYLHKFVARVLLLPVLVCRKTLLVFLGWLCPIPHSRIKLFIYKQTNWFFICFKASLSLSLSVPGYLCPKNVSMYINALILIHIYLNNIQCDLSFL